MGNSLEKTMVNLFLFKNRNVTDIHVLNRNFIDFYYKMDRVHIEKLDISFLWGEILKKWNDKQAL